MAEKAFTMTSNQYCGSCGSFDLVKIKSGWVSRRIMNVRPVMFCYGCDCQFPENDFINNSIRTVPFTSDDFFFQTNIRTRQLKKRQIQPLTLGLGLSLIVGSLASLFIYKSPPMPQKLDSSTIEWASVYSNVAETYETDVVKALQLEFDKLVKAR